MPELPEVETVVRTLRPKLVGRIISGVRLERTDILDPADTDLAGHLLGRAVTLVDRRGKRIVITLDNGNRFYIHLGMTGQLTIEPIDAPLKTHTHLILELSGRVGSASADGISPVSEAHGSPTIAPAKAGPTKPDPLQVRFR